MKYSLTILFLGLFFTTQAQSKKKKLINAKESITVEEMRKINPSLIDTIFQQTPDGNLQMRLEVAKNLDTIYVEDHATGHLTMKVVRASKKRTWQPKPKGGSAAIADTVYVEDPATGNIRMMITNKQEGQPNNKGKKDPKQSNWLENKDRYKEMKEKSK